MLQLQRLEKSGQAGGYVAEGIGTVAIPRRVKDLHRLFSRLATQVAETLLSDCPNPDLILLSQSACRGGFKVKKEDGALNADTCRAIIRYEFGKAKARGW